MRRQYFLKKSQAIVEGQQQELGAALAPRAHFSGGQEGRNLFLLNIEGFEHHHLLPDPCAGSTSCHDSPRAIQHVTQAGNSAFGTRTLGQDRLLTEVCADCHAPGGFQAVDFVHRLK